MAYGAFGLNSQSFREGAKAPGVWRFSTHYRCLFDKKVIIIEP